MPDSERLGRELLGMGELVVFQGDSITHGGRGETEDPNHVLGHSYPFLIAAEAGATHPDLGRRFVNRGISGDTLAAMTARWQRDVLDLRPDVLSILIGVNDVGGGSWPTPGSPRSPVRRNAVRVRSPAAG